MFDNILRNGVWLRRRKKWLPLLFLASVIFAMLATPPFTMIKNTIPLTAASLLIAAIGFIVRYYALQVRTNTLPDMIEAQGIYANIRFPIYLSNILIILSLTLYVGIVWYLVLVGLLCRILAERIILSEENTMLNMYAQEFTTWAKQTRSLMPNPFNWVKPNYYIAKRDAIGLLSPYMLITSGAFMSINLLKNIMIDFSFRIGYFWLLLFVACAAIFLFFRILRRQA